MLADNTKYAVVPISSLPADAHIRRSHGINKATCAYYLFTLVSYYQTAMSFNLYAILHELDTLHA